MVLSKYSHSISNGVPDYKQSLVVQIFMMNDGTKEENRMVSLILNMSIMVCLKALFKGNLTHSPC